MRRCWMALCKHLGVDVSQSRGVTLASLRGGGATALYLFGASIADIAWCGGWSSTRTLEIYIQEVAALTSLKDLRPADQARISLFADALPRILRDYVTNNSQRGVSPPA